VPSKELPNETFCVNDAARDIRLRPSLSETAGFIRFFSHMNTVPVWVNLLNPVRRLAGSADCNQHRARLCANGRRAKRTLNRKQSFMTSSERTENYPNL
jgi:hypothetical protein